LQVYVNNTKLRAARLARLAELSQQGSEEAVALRLLLANGESGTDAADGGAPAALPLVPDGVADDGMDDVHMETGSVSAPADAVATEGVGGPLADVTEMNGIPAAASLPAAVSAAQESTSAAAPAAPSLSTSASATTASGEPRLLTNMRACYICKKRYRELHTFYDTLCPTCAGACVCICIGLSMHWRCINTFWLQQPTFESEDSVPICPGALRW
jgi:hypothetical protein